MLHLTDQKEYEQVALNWYRKLKKRGCENCQKRIRGILTAWYGYIPKEMLDKIIENLKTIDSNTLSASIHPTKSLSASHRARKESKKTGMNFESLDSWARAKMYKGTPETSEELPSNKDVKLKGKPNKLPLNKDVPLKQACKCKLPRSRDVILQAKFDESKINRDKLGQFATKPGGSKKSVLRKSVGESTELENQDVPMGLFTEFKKSWDKIPPAHKEGLSDLVLNTEGEDYTTGNYDGWYSHITVTASTSGIGMAAVQRHELQHHRWNAHRTFEEINNWITGAKKIYQETGIAPSAYVKRFEARINPERDLKYRNELTAKVKAYQNMIDNDRYPIRIVYDVDYRIAQIEITQDKLSTGNLGKEDRDFLKASIDGFTEALEKQQDDFDLMAIDAKREVAQTHIRNIREQLASRFLFYNEAHSDVGTYIYQKEDMIAHGNIQPAFQINHEVIDQYVDLYKKVFKD